MLLGMIYNINWSKKYKEMEGILAMKCVYKVIGSECVCEWRVKVVEVSEEEDRWRQVV